jgi:hypothetical protein
MIKVLYALGELLAGAVAISMVALLILPDWRKNPQYVLAGWLFGPLAGFIVLRFGMHDGWALLAATIGAIMAPAIVAWLHGKSPADVAQELIDIRNKLKNKS